MAALVPRAHPPTRWVQAGVALTASDWEGVDAACQSMTAPRAIERAERERARWRRGGRISGGQEEGGKAGGTPLLVGLGLFETFL
jgi:hypothetical protein